MIDKLAKFILSLAVLLATSAGAAEPFAPGAAQAELIKFQLAVYYTPAPAQDPLAALRSAAGDWPALAIVTLLPTEPPGLLVQARMEMNVPVKYAPPDAKALVQFGRGMNRTQMQAVQASQQALQLNFYHDKAHAMEGLRTAYGVAEQVARMTGGLLWDEETREMFTPDKWHEQRLAGWTGGVPDVSKSTTVHAYKSGTLSRAITLGMAKFGLPDIVINQFPWTSNASMGSIINLLAQAMAEGTPVGADGNVELNVDSTSNRKGGARMLLAPSANSRSVAHLALMKGKPENGDPANRLAEITFGRYPGADAPARQDAMLADLFGDTSQVKAIRHNAELSAASQAAQMKLAGLQADFARGLRPGETIQVKAPFAKASGGNEWIWVEVTKWNDGKIEGLLTSEPAAIPALHVGQLVHVRQDKVFDYVRNYPDGRKDGNTTGKIIQKMDAAK